ncbi:hypothetical protein [Nostoc sp.]|uniref:hypothetical protein n=1 Tax=Nostoc sp. TaxID=1180 RepID=UPI002FF6843D
MGNGAWGIGHGEWGDEGDEGVGRSCSQFFSSASYAQCPMPNYFESLAMDL